MDAAGFGPGGAAGAGAGMSAAMMRRIGGAPPKAASLGSIGLMGHSGGAASGATAAGGVFYGHVSSTGAVFSPGGTHSATGSASSAALAGGGGASLGGGAGGAATGILLGSGTSSPQFLSPGATRANLLVPPPGSAAAAAAAAAAALATSSGAYAGLSDETRARLARLRGNSAADLQQEGGAVPSGRVSMAAMPISVDSYMTPGGGTGTPASAGVSRHASLGMTPTGWGSGAAAAAAAGLGSPGGAFLAAAASGALGSGASGGGGGGGIGIGNLVSPPESVTALLESLGLGHYAKSIAGAVPGGLVELGGLDDAGLRKVGLVSSRSRQLVQEELRRWGYRSSRLS